MTDDSGNGKVGLTDPSYRISTFINKSVRMECVRVVMVEVAEASDGGIILVNERDMIDVDVGKSWKSS